MTPQICPWPWAPEIQLWSEASHTLLTSCLKRSCPTNREKWNIYQSLAEFHKKSEKDKSKSLVPDPVRHQWKWRVYALRLRTLKVPCCKNVTLLSLHKFSASSSTVSTLQLYSTTFMDISPHISESLSPIFSHPAWLLGLAQFSTFPDHLLTTWLVPVTKWRHGCEVLCEISSLRTSKTFQTTNVWMYLHSVSLPSHCVAPY